MNARVNARIVCALMMVANMSSVNAQERAPSWNLTTLYTFLGEADGASPGEVGLDPAGNLYGTTAFGGQAGCGPYSYGCGVAFEVNARGHERILHTFTAAPDGADSYVGLLRDSSGVFYGETNAGGSNGAGIIFKLTPPPTACGAVLCPWHETILHQFAGGSGDGAGPEGDLIEDSSGNIYGTTSGGGSMGFGAVFKLDSAGNESILYFFGNLPDGQYPFGALLRDQAGNLYGTTNTGGTSNAGTVFELSPSPSGWTEQVLYDFTGGSDGGFPLAGLIADEQGNLYGTTTAGGDLNCGALGSCGVVFELSPSPHRWSETVLYTFTGSPDGADPLFGALIRDGAGNLYGTTSQGGIATGCYGEVGCGTVFELSPNGSGWTETVLYSFTGEADGNAPIGPVTMDAHGNLYGAAYYGGDLNSNSPACQYGGSPIGCGVVFKLTP